MKKYIENTIELISEDVVRCNNHRCMLRTNCKRYMQLAADKREKRFWIIPHRYEPHNDTCNSQIPFKS